MRFDVCEASKTYGRRTVVDRLSFAREGPGITALLGANGSGKSTTLRMMLGLSRPDSGVLTIDGCAFTKLDSPGLRVGVMLDAQANHRGRSGLEILRLSAQTLGLSKRRATEMLEKVGLARAASKRFGSYSLGMKQRLGLAQALLAEPELLILDEPANGLDPEGILWMRDLLRQFAHDGGTVLLSSHLLSEVELLVDSVIMIGDGRLVADAPLSHLVSQRRVRVTATDQHALEIALRHSGIVFVPVEGSASIDVTATCEQVSGLSIRFGIVLSELRPSPTDSLESTFFRLTSPVMNGVDHVRL